MLSVRIPHKNPGPVVIVVNCPVGGSVCRSSLAQQVTVPSVRIPHHWVMVVNLPIDSGVVCPYPLAPQQVMLLLVRIPHE